MQQIADGSLQIVEHVRRSRKSLPPAAASSPDDADELFQQALDIESDERRGGLLGV